MNMTEQTGQETEYVDFTNATQEDFFDAWEGSDLFNGVGSLF